MSHGHKPKDFTDAAQAQLPPIVRPAVLATNGDLTLYADFSIGSAELDAYNAGYSGDSHKIYGLFPPDAAAAFPEFASDPTAAGTWAYNQAQLHGPFGTVASWQQGCGATLSPDGHGYVHGSVHAIRGTLAVPYKTTEVQELIAAAKGQYFIQVEQGAAGPFYANVG